MRGITRAIVAVVLIVGAVPAVGAAQYIDYTDADAGPSGSVSNAGAAAVHANHQDGQAADPDGENGSADGGANESDATEPAAGGDVDGDGSAQLVDDPSDYFERLQCLETLPYDYDEPELVPCEDDSDLVLVVGGGGDGLTAIQLDLAVAGDGDSDGAAGDGSTAHAAGDGSGAPAPVSDDWWDRVRCLRPLPVDPAPPIEPIPCEDDGELVLMRTNGDDSEGFPVQGGVIRVHRFDPAAGDGVDVPVRKRPGRTKYADITLERGYVLRADTGSNDGVGPALEPTDSWIVVPASDDADDGEASGDEAHGNDDGDGTSQAGSASSSKAELIESLARYEAGDGGTGNVLGGVVLAHDDGSQSAVIVVKELDRASPLLYEALADDHGDDRRTVLLVTKEIDKASPKLYEARDPDDDGDGVPTDRTDATVGADDTDGAHERTGVEEAATVVGPDDTPCPIQWPTGPFDPTDPTTVPCPVFAAFTMDTGGVAGAVSPSDSHSVAGAVSPSDSHSVVGAITPSDSHAVAGAISPSDFRGSGDVLRHKEIDSPSPMRYAY